MSVRARPRVAQLAPTQTAGPAPPSGKHLPLSVVLKTGFDTGIVKKGEDLESEEGALCYGQVRFVAKKGLSNNMRSFEFRVKRAPRPFDITQPFNFLDRTKMDEPYYIVVPDSLDEVVEMLQKLHKQHPDDYLIIDDGYADDGLSLFYPPPLHDVINRSALAEFLAEKGIRQGHQDCVIYLSPVESFDYALATWKENGERPRRT